MMLAAVNAPTLTLVADLVVLGSAVVGFSTAVLVALHAGRQVPVHIQLNGVYTALQDKLAGVEQELALAQDRIQLLEADLSVIESACPFRVLAARKGLRTIGQLYAPQTPHDAPRDVHDAPQEDQYDADFP